MLLLEKFSIFFRKETLGSLSFFKIENNKSLDKTIVYCYDNIGNITSVKTYAYTLQATDVSGSYTEKTLTYNPNIPDRLISYGGTGISYNSMGFPTSYDGYTASWTRGKLSRLSKGLKLTGTHTYSFSYNGLGQRTGRSYLYTQGTANASEVLMGMLLRSNRVYHYDNCGRLICESNSSEYYLEESTFENVVYLYDNNSVIGMVYTGYGETNTCYYFNRNVLGDVIGIYDTNGTKVAGYVYDAFGNCSITSDTTKMSVAHANSFRYRGYYYDEDTKLYYLNARYYSPEWRRFISPDSTDYLDPETPNGLNLYAYCNNDPINYVDPSGNLGISLAALGAIILGVVGAAIGGVVTYNVAKDNGAEGWDLFGYTMLGVLGGGLVGALAGAGLGALITKATGILGFSITKYYILSVKKITVLGNMKTFVGIAEGISAGYFLIPFDKIPTSLGFDMWTSNMTYLTDANKLGSQFVIVPEKVVEAGTFLWREIHFLIENSIPWIMP